MKKTKQIISILMCTLVLFASSVCIYANEEISVYINNQKVAFDVQPQIIEGRTMVPLRAIFENLGAEVQWDGATKTVTSVKGNTRVVLVLNSNIMTVDGNEIILDVPATELNGRTLVPVRAISEAYNCQVGWDGKERVVSVISDSDNYQMLYAPENRSRSFANHEVEPQLNQGWYRNAELTDNMTDEMIYNKLKSRGEVSAYSCAETVVRNLHKNPDSVKILDRAIIDSDKYLRYVVRVNASGMNAMGGYVTSEYYIMLRIHSAMDGHFTYYTGSLLGYEFPYTDEEKEAFDWGKRPEDFGITALPQNAEVVSIKQIIAFPERYVGKYVTIQEDFKIGKNYIKDKKFYSFPLDDRGYSMTEASISISYQHVENLDECVLSEDDRVFKVSGYVRTYSNSTEAYIDAGVIEFK